MVVMVVMEGKVRELGGKIVFVELMKNQRNDEINADVIGIVQFLQGKEMHMGLFGLMKEETMWKTRIFGLVVVGDMVMIEVKNMGVGGEVVKLVHAEEKGIVMCHLHPVVEINQSYTQENDVQWKKLRVVKQNVLKSVHIDCTMIKNVKIQEEGVVGVVVDVVLIFWQVEVDHVEHQLLLGCHVFLPSPLIPQKLLKLCNHHMRVEEEEVVNMTLI